MKTLYIRLITLVALLSATLTVAANRKITKTEVYEFSGEPYGWYSDGYYSQDPLTEEENTNWRGVNFEVYGEGLKGEGNLTDNIYLETIASLPGRVTKVTIEAKAWTTEGWVRMNVNNGDDEYIQTTDQYDMDAISYEDYVFNNPTDNGGYLKISFSLSTYARIYIRNITVEYEYEVPNEPYALLSNENKTLTFYYDDQKDLNDYLSVGPFDDPEDQSWKDHKESITTVNFDNSFANYTALSSTRYWFHNCENLTTINNLSNLKTSQVTDMVGMFGGCSSLTALDLSSFDTGNVLDMRRMFNSCSNLTNLDVSSFNTSKVTKMGGMFNDCPVLVNLDITNFNTSKVTDMSLMFSGCSSLVSLDLSNFNTAAVTTMTHMFYGCTNLTTITVACEWNTDAVTESSDMFLDCTSIKGRKGTTYDPNHIDKSYAHNDEGASNPGYLTDKLEVYAIEESESGKYVLTFYYDNKKKTRDYPKSIGPFSSFNAVSWYSHAYWFNTVRFDSSMAECTNITSTAYWFYGFTELTTIEGLEYLNTSNVTDMAGMFGHCYQMTSIDVSHFDTSNVTDMNAMFNMCTYLTSIDVSHFNTSNVTNMESMFNDCKKLTILDLSSFNTANVTTMSRMFEGCQELKRLDLSSFNTNNVTNPWSMFSGCSSLTRIYVSDQWKASSLGYTSGMFSNCTSLVGGAGTVYDSNHTDGSYAHIDGGTDNPGYLTERGIEPYAVLSSDNKTLTFKYDMEWGANALSIGPFDGYSDRGWYDHREDITKVVFDDSFAQYTGLTSTFTWFDQSSNIATIEGLHNLNTENVVNMRSMFEECSSLTSLDLSSFNTAKVTDFGNMFAGCSNLATIFVGEGWSTAAITEESTYMFGGCTSLVGGAGTTYADAYKDVAYAHIDDTSNPGYLTDANTREPYAVLTDNDDDVTIDGVPGKGKTLTFYYDSKKEDRGGMNVGPFISMYSRNWNSNASSITSVVLDESFANCTSLTSTAYWFNKCKNLISIIGIENLKTSNVTDMEGMFSDCSSLTSLDVSGFNTTNVTDMEGMFSGCSSLTSLDVSGFNTTNVTDMTSMFAGCSGLTSLDVSRFNTTNVTRMNSMFSHCSGLTSLDVSNFKNDNVTTMSSLFSGCSSLTSLNVSNFNTTNATNMGFMFKDCSNLSSLDVSNFKTDNATRMAGMFSGCSSLTSLDVSGFNTANVTNMNSMFHGCSSLTSLDVSGFNTTNVIDMSFMFYGCSSLTSLDVSGFKTDKVIDMESMFTACSGLTSLDLSSFNTSEVKYDADKYLFGIQNMFSDCSALTTIYVGEGWNVENLTECTYVFKDCTALVGGKGTTYDANHTDYTYAHIDGGTSNPGYLTYINMKDVTITAKSYSREYCEANPTFEYTVEGATLSGEPTITCEATATSPVGTYPIVITYSTDDAAKMNLTYVNGTLTITKAPLTITAKSYTIKRGEAIPTLEVEYSGFKNNETDAVFTKKPTVSTEAKSDALAGTYDIVVSGAEAANYEIEYVNGTLTITDDVTVTAKNYSRVYGDANPSFEFTSEGATLSGTPTITCEATATSPVGTYAIVIAKGSISNGTVTYVNGTLTITKAPLTITAKSYSVKQGKELPTLELEYSGFKNNETDTVFTTKPTATTRATKNSDPGAYDITVSGAEAKNYEMKYVNGTLTITERTETFSGTVVTVNEGGNLDDAFESIGGREEAAKTIAAIIWNNNVPLTDDMLEGISNPNLLIYVSEASMAPEGARNLVVNGRAKNIELVDADGNNNFFAPQEFTAESISYSHVFNQVTQDGICRGWEGIALPFNVQKFIHEEHGEISPFGDTTCDYHFWLRQPTDNGVINALSIEANKPYIISMPNCDEYEEEFNHPGLLRFTSTNVTIPVTEVEGVWLGDSAQIVPTFENIEASPDIYVLNVGDSLQNHPEGSIFVSNYRSVRPFEIYTFHEPNRNEGAGARIISLSSLYGGKNTTGVVDTMKAAESDGEVWYDMNGRRLQSKPVRKGVYIKNGKKVVIK